MMMKKILCALCVCLMTTGAAQADLVSLNLPAAGNHSDGSVFSTSTSFNGATFNIEYALNAFAADETTEDAFINSTGSFFGVGSVGDPNAGNERSIDGDDGEQLSITNLSITNFNAGTSGLVVGDLNISFDSLAILNGTAAPDGIEISFTGFGDTQVDVQQPGTVDLTGLTNFSSSSTALYIQPDTTASNNRWSVSGISVDVTAVPEPSSFAMFCAIGGLLMGRRRKP